MYLEWPGPTFLHWTYSDDWPNKKDNRGYTALHMASKEGLDAHCQILLEHGADPNTYGVDEYAKTPLHRARTQKVVDVLLDAGSNPFAKELHTKVNFT